MRYYLRYGYVTYDHHDNYYDHNDHYNYYDHNQHHHHDLKGRFMASLRAVEERDAKGRTIRFNPSGVFKQDHEIRKVVGRHDWHMLDNPDYHETITAQAQNGKILFFRGTPETPASRAAAKEIPQSEVPEYIIEGLRKHPMKVREPRPTVYEVRLATVGDQEITEVTQIDTDGMPTLDITPVEPNLDPSTIPAAQRASRAAAAQALAEGA